MPLDPTEILRNGMQDAFSGLRAYSDGNLRLAQQGSDRRYAENQLADQRGYTENLRKTIRNENLTDEQRKRREGISDADLERDKVEAQKRNEFYFQQQTKAASFGIDPKGKTSEELAALIHAAEIGDEQKKADRELQNEIRRINAMDDMALKKTASSMVDAEGKPLIPDSATLSPELLRSKIAVATRRVAEVQQQEKQALLNSGVELARKSPEYQSIRANYAALVQLRSRAMTPMIPDLTPSLTPEDKRYLGEQIVTQFGSNLGDGTKRLFAQGLISEALKTLKAKDQQAIGMGIGEMSAKLLEGRSTAGLKEYLAKVAQADNQARNVQGSIDKLVEVVQKQNPNAAYALMGEDLDSIVKSNVEAARPAPQGPPLPPGLPQNQSGPIAPSPNTMIRGPVTPGPGQATPTAPIAFQPQGPEIPFSQRDMGVSGMVNLFNPSSPHNIVNRTYGGISGLPLYSDQTALQILGNPTVENSAIGRAFDTMKRFGIRRGLSDMDNWDAMTPEQQQAFVDEARRYDPIIQRGVPDYSQF